MPRTEKWSLKFDRCVRCGRDDVKHLGRGLCRYCYQQETEKRGRGKQGIARGLASTKLNYKYLYDEYVNKKRSLADIAKDCDCARQYVYKKMREFDIPLRTQIKARKLAYDRNKISYTIVDENGEERLITQGSTKINETFFMNWSREMAYVLGIIYTDGNLYHDPKRGSYRITISQKESELLNKVLKLMDCDARIRYRKQRGISGGIHFLDFTHKNIFSDLIRLGLSPNKSNTIEFPRIQTDFVRHFIRGCWDGDGSIYFESKHLRASYTCGSLKFIEGLVQELYKVGIYKRKPPVDNTLAHEMISNYPDGRFPLKIHEDKRYGSYYIKVDTRENIERLFHYIYDDVDESMYLARKYKVFVKGLNTECAGETDRLTLDLPI